MIDYLYKFPDEETAQTVLADYYEDGWKTSGQGFALDPIGTLTDTDSSDPENPVTTVLDGWHVNLRITDGRPTLPLQHTVTPATQRRVWLTKILPLLALCLLVLPGCRTAHQDVKDCLPAAISAREILHKQGVPARVLVVHWEDGATLRGHAYTVFRYGRAYAYDKNFGSIPLDLGTDLEVPAEVAFDANMRRGHYGAVTMAEYLDPEET
jgi:hypothetical protein